MKKLKQHKIRLFINQYKNKLGILSGGVFLLLSYVFDNLWYIAFGAYVMYVVRNWNKK